MFWQLFKESVILQAVLAIEVTSVVCYMYLAGMEVPTLLVGLVGVIIGYYFGEKTGVAKGLSARGK